jgi:hypothetical protein
MKYGYLHVPKTGGTFIKRALKDNSNFLELDEETLCAKEYSKQLNEYKKNNSVFILSSVRNPFDLLLSYYSSGFQSSPYRGTLGSFVNHGNKKWYNMTTENYSFEKFLDDFIAMSDVKFKDYYQYYQSNFLYYQLFNENENCLVDHIFRQETLTEDLKSFCGEHNLIYTEPILNTSSTYGPELRKSHKNQRINSSRDPNESYRQYYTSRMVDKIQKHFKKDLDFFDYSF